MSLQDVGPVVLVGAGKMGLALARGWIAGGLPPAQLVLVDPYAGDAAKTFAGDNGIRLLKTTEHVLTHVLVLAVKPQVDGRGDAAGAAERRQADAGDFDRRGYFARELLSHGLGTERVVRCMPNTPAQVGKGITGAVGLDISNSDQALADDLLGAAGAVVWFDEESKLDAVTAVSGSGPAYVFYLVEALAVAGMRQGLDPGQAMQLARQTVVGAAALMEADSQSVSMLRENVTSPKGTTAAALAVLMAPDGLEALMDRAVLAARVRSEELGRG